MADDNNERGIRLFKRAESLRAKRQSIFDSPAQEISDYFWPDVSDINTEKTESTTGWFDDIYDSAPMRASQSCSVGVRNWVTPSTEPWLDMSPPTNLPKKQRMPINPRLARLGQQPSEQVDENGMDEAQRWCAEEAAAIMEELSAGSFYSMIQPFNRSACVFGTSLLFSEEDDDGEVVFEQFKFGTYVIAENKKKRVDTVVRWFKYTVRQACQKFGEENLPRKMRELYAKGKFDEKFTFLHHVFPNEDYKAGEIGHEGMAFASVYQSEVEKKIVKEGGYEEMPYFCVRWSRWGTDDQPYGCSPAFECLAEGRQINTVTQFNDALVELKAYPRWLCPDNLDGQVQLAAGGYTVVGADDMAAGKVPKEWMTQGETQEIGEMLARKEKAINEAFFVDIFKALGQLEDKKMTLGEVSLRMGEKLDQFTGTFDQYRTELINPLVARMIGIRMRAGRSKEPPQSLMVQPGGDPKAAPQLALPKIQIKSRVTLALAEVRNVGTQKTMETLMPLAEARPDVLDNFNLDNVARNTARAYGMPESNLNSWKAMMELRKQRAEQVKQQRAMEMAEQVATAAGKLGKAPQKMQDAVASQMPAEAA